MGGVYFEGVYEMNNPKHVEENQASAQETKNLYKFLANERVRQPKVKVSLNHKKETAWKPHIISD